MAKTADYGLGEFPYPRGWLMVAAADKVTRVPTEARFFGEDEVLYRGASGRPVVLDAYCPHMGAHLAVGPIGASALRGVQGGCIKRTRVHPGLAVQSDDDILEAYLRFGNTAFHVSGTCRTGSDERSVVDPTLKVCGVDRLRVVDTSIMPTLVSGNTNAPAMAIELRAAKILEQDDHR